MSKPFVKQIEVPRNSGAVTVFIPLYRPVQSVQGHNGSEQPGSAGNAMDPLFETLFDKPPASFMKAIADIKELIDAGVIQGPVPSRQANPSRNSSINVAAFFNDLDLESCKWQQVADKKYVIYKPGIKVWSGKGHIKESVFGVWLIFLTNLKKHKGIVKKTRSLTELEKKEILDLFLQTRAANENGNKHKDENGIFQLEKCARYMPDPDNQSEEIDCSFTLSLLGISKSKKTPICLSFDSNKIKFVYKVTPPHMFNMVVDVIADIGNNRCSILLFKHPVDGQVSMSSLEHSLSVLNLQADSYSGEYELSNEYGVTPSWFVLRAPEFTIDPDTKDEELDMEFNVNCKIAPAKLFSKKKSEPQITGNVVIRYPRSGLPMSIIAMGDEANELCRLEQVRHITQNGACISFFSPKKHFADKHTRHVIWKMVPRDIKNQSPSCASAVNIESPLLMYIQEKTGKAIKIDGMDPANIGMMKPHNPTYPQRITTILTIFGILEKAQEQANRVFGGNRTALELGKLVVTNPSWTLDEVIQYRVAINEAIYIYNSLKGANVKLAPPQVTSDESLSGIMVVLLGIIQRLRLPAGKMIDIMGKEREIDCTKKKTLRAINIDMGGGTSDICVLDIMDNADSDLSAQVNLCPRVLFRDSKPIAGDDFQQKIIEQIILPALLKALPNDDDKRLLKKYFQCSCTEKEMIDRSCLVRTVLVPMAIYCMTHTDETEFSILDSGCNANDLENFCKTIFSDSKRLSGETLIKYSAQQIRRIVKELFGKLFRYVAWLAAKNNVDILMLSGKLSECKPVVEFAKANASVVNGLVIFARDFRPGNYYPLRDERGCVSDGKTVTAVGCALHYAISSGFIEDWHIDMSEKMKPVFAKNSWGHYKHLMSGGKCFMSSDEDEVNVELNIPITIGRRQCKLVTPSPVYRLQRKDNKPETNVSVTFKREVIGGNNERLVAEIDGVKCGSANSAYELAVSPYPEEDENGNNNDFWMESGLLAVYENG